MTSRRSHSQGTPTRRLPHRAARYSASQWEGGQHRMVTVEEEEEGGGMGELPDMENNEEERPDPHPTPSPIGGGEEEVSHRGAPLNFP